jgi:ribose transport system ATP-binding protein
LQSALLDITNLSKRFGGVAALDGVSLSIAAGEVHGLLGENGSGKSTLIKILAGYHEPEEDARLTINGQSVALPLHPGQFRELGISFVHQDLGLVESLTVLDNLRVGRYEPSLVGHIDWRRERQAATDMLATFNLAIDPDQKIGELRDIDRALIAIVRAVADIEGGGGRGLLVLDEPTVYLPRDSIEHLFRIMREVAQRGNAVLFVTHHLREVLAVTNRVTVLRDGRVAGTVTTSRTSEKELVSMIIGRVLDDADMVRASNRADGSTVRVTDLQGGSVQGSSFAIGDGEILGVTGLVGMGFEDVPGLMYGALKCIGGTLEIHGVSYSLPNLTPKQSRHIGIAMVPANRLRHAVVPSLTVADNLMLPVLSRHFRGLRLDIGSLNREATRLLTEFDVRPPDPNRRMGTLSGGNQQKAVLAKWLQNPPRLLLLHEPTQGVDVGARREIFEIIRNVALSGTAVLVASAEEEDLERLCDRILVFKDGEPRLELSGADVNAGRIQEACYYVAAQPTELVVG